MNDVASIGHLLRRHRKSRGWTQEQLADRVALSTETARKIESNIWQPSAGTMEVLADALELSPEERANFISLGRRQP